MATTGVAVVTGAGSGLGRCIARALLSAEWRVAAAGRREHALRESVASGAWPVESALTVPADVTVPESVAVLFAAVQRRWGRVDLLVNNAGVFGPAGAVDEISWADWRQVVDTNLTGAFLCAQHAVRMMKAQTPGGGRIINNGSVSAHTPRPAAGRRLRGSRAHLRRRARWRRGAVHGVAAAGRQRAIPDHHRHDDAVHRPGMRLTTG